MILAAPDRWWTGWQKKKRLNSGYILKVILMKFDDWFSMGFKKEVIECGRLKFGQ